MALQSQADTRGRETSQADAREDGAKKRPARINPFWAGKVEHRSPGTAVPGPGKRQRGSAWSTAQATVLAPGADWASLPVYVVSLWVLFPFYFILCDMQR